MLALMVAPRQYARPRMRRYSPEFTSSTHDRPLRWAAQGRRGVRLTSRNLIPRREPITFFLSPRRRPGPMLQPPVHRNNGIGLRRHGSGGHGYDHMNRSIRTLVTP